MPNVRAVRWRTPRTEGLPEPTGTRHAARGCASADSVGYIEVRASHSSGKNLQAQRLGQVGHAGGAAGAGLVADDAFDRLHVLEAPELEAVIQVDQPLGQLVQIPVLLGIVVHASHAPVTCLLAS